MTTMVDRIDWIRDDDFLADKKRFESFKLGGAPPLATQSSSSQPKRHSHSRSHSRNVSVSISPSPSLPLPFSVSSHDPSLSLFSSSSSPASLSQLSSTSAAGTKRGSHHRRRSSVSTRRESAEVMGVSLPTLSASNSEDNMSLGDKDSIRRRALWALEGKSNADGFSPVEIPELSTPEIERRISELPSKPSFPPSMASFVSGISGLSNMRDSLSNRLSSSIKDQLHTLVEEEEEEEEEPEAPSSPPTWSAAGAAIAPTSPTPTRARSRPAGLSLRPLSLSPDRLLSGTNSEPTTSAPACTPSKPSGLKSLTLITSPSLVSSPPSDGVLTSAASFHRRSIVVPPTHAVSSAPFFRRPDLTNNPPPGSSDPFEVPKRRSSISYKPSHHGLPTPELTPTTDCHASTGSDGDWPRPSSVSNEQHFLFQSQAALVARIAELERALSSRTQSRPTSFAASDMSSGGSEPTDEMLCFVADLKAERDELKRDIVGWHTRVADLKKQNGVLAQCVDVEQREAFIALENLEIQKSAAARRAEESAAALSALQAEVHAMREEAARSKETVLELEFVKAELAEERRRRVELEKALEALSRFNAPTPIIPARHVMSIDSLGSVTDVDSLDGHVLTGSGLKSVQEVDEDEEPYSDHENNLMGYEDEEEGDESFISHDSSSFSSLEDIPRSTGHLVSSVSPSPSLTPLATSFPTHAKRSSLSREWSFPVKGTPHAASPQHVPEEIDRFFGCLEDIGDSPPTSAALPDTPNPFSRKFFGVVEDDDDELPPFVLPVDVGIEVESPPTKDSVLSAGSGLDVVLEEEEELGDTMGAGTEDEFIGEEDEGGIKFTFKTPSAFVSPESSQTPSPTTPELMPLGHKPMPYYEPVTEAEDDDHTPFPFPVVCLASRTRASPPSPSSIPRATALKRFEGLAKDAKFSPRAPTSPPSPRTSPSNIRGGSRPSFLPQPITKSVSAPTFIPQPMTKASSCSSMSSAQSRWRPPSGETAVRSSSADASSSVSARPFATLQNLASLVPFSWPSARASSEIPSTVEANNYKAEERRKGFVSKERQLARLRQRMAAEEGAEGQTHVQQKQAGVLPCRRCVDRVVSP